MPVIDENVYFGLDIFDEEDIEHFGVKGMKWGIRKNRKKSVPTPKKKLTPKEQQAIAVRRARILLGAYFGYKVIGKPLLAVGKAAGQYYGKGALYKVAVAAHKRREARRAEQDKIEKIIKLAAENIDYIDLKFAS